ncbi:MAG: limonene-1,2-epoxide hydrolase family protein [Pseudomonadota bacterium]
MHWDDYKRRCDQPDHWSRWFLTQLLALAPTPAVETELRAVLQSTPIPKPRDHRGGAATDMFVVSLSGDLVSSLINRIRAATDEPAMALPAALQQRGLGGFAEALAEYLDYRYQDAGHRFRELEQREHWKGGSKMGQAGETVMQLIDAFNRNDLDAIVACFAEDAVYHNMPMEPLTGTAAIRAGLQVFLNDATAVEWIVHHLLESADGTVLTERLDRFELNGRWLEIPVMGTFEVDGSRIRAWRDYFDLADFQRQMAALTP